MTLEAGIATHHWFDFPKSHMKGEPSVAGKPKTLRLHELEKMREVTSDGIHQNNNFNLNVLELFVECGRTSFPLGG